MDQSVYYEKFANNSKSFQILCRFSPECTLCRLWVYIHMYASICIYKIVCNIQEEHICPMAVEYRAS